MIRSLHLSVLLLLAGVIVAPVEAQVPENVITTNAEDAQSVYAIDVDGDGDTDVLSASENDHKIVWYESDGSPDPSFTAHTIATDAFGAQSVYATDIDGDGDTDVLSASFDDNKIAWYENNGSSDPSFTSRTITTDAYNAQQVYATDIDGDGDTDILSASDGKIEWYENDGSSDPNFSIRTVSSDLGGQVTSVFAADVDGDGDTDVISSALGTFDRIYWHENDGSSNPSFTDRTVTAGSFRPISVRAADIDGDGDTDLLSASNIGEIAWYENEGSSAPDFTERTIKTDADGLTSVFAADVEGDEDIDILSSSSGIGADGIVRYENDGASNPSFTPQVINSNFAQNVYARDIDGDEDADLFSASLQENKVAWYENTWSNVPPTVGTNEGLSLAEGGSATITTSELSASDPDDRASSLMFDVTSGPSRGDLLVNGSSATGFTQADLENGNVEYNHTAGDGDDDSFTFTASDGQKTTSEKTFSISVSATNDPPTVSLSPSSESIDENNSSPIVVSTISVSDDNLGTNNLSLSGTDVSAFNINSSDQLEFTETADYETKSSYSVTVEVDDPNVGSDPDDSESFSLSITDVNEAPRVATNAGLSVSEGATKTITTSELSASDPDDGASSLTFSVASGPGRGNLLANGTSATSFTQADLENGNVAYSHTAGDATDDSFAFTVTDGQKRTSEQTFSISVTTVNTAPSAPTGLVAGGGDQQASLTWDSNPESDMSGGQYKVHRSTTSGFAPGSGSLVATISHTGNGESYTDSSLTNGTTYHYRLTAVDSTGDESDSSNEVEVTPRAINLSEGLVAYYPFNGNADDESGNGYDGIVNGAAIASDRSGEPDRAYEFDASGSTPDYITLDGTNSLSLEGNFSLSLWVKYGNQTDDNKAILVDRDIVGTRSDDWSTRIRPSGGEVVFYSRDTNLNGNPLVTDSSYADQRWHHVVFTRDGSQDRVRIFIDGELVAEDQDRRNTFSGTPEINIGAWNTNGFENGFTGKLDELRFYSRTLLEAEVQGLYEAEASTSLASPTDLVATAGNQSVSLSWSPGSENTSPSDYNVYRDTTSFSDVADVTKVNASPISDTSYTDTDLTNGTTYHYRVTAVDTDGNESDFSGEVAAMPEPEYLLGDPSSDSTVTAADASLVLQYAVDLRDFDRASWLAAEVSGDSTVNAPDASLILQYVVDLIDQFPVVGSDSTSGMIAGKAATTGLSHTGAALKWGELTTSKEKGVVKLPVQLSGSSADVQSATLTLEFDPEATQIEDVEPRLSSGWQATHNVNREEGTLQLAMAGAKPADEGELATLHLDVKSKPGATADRPELTGTVSLNGGKSRRLATKELRSIPSSLSLEANYPNPVRQETTIEYGLPKETQVQVELYDVLGRRVETLVHEKQRAGLHTTTVKAAGLSSGTYFYRVEAAGSVRTGRLTIVR